MKRLRSALFIIIPALMILFFQTTSCEKLNPVNPETNKCPEIPPVCDVRGTYTGTSTDNGNGIISPMAYQLKDDNFAVGNTSPGSPAVSYGSYVNTCDSVRLTVFYTNNNDYYLLKGK